MVQTMAFQSSRCFSRSWCMVINFSKLLSLNCKIIELKIFNFVGNKAKGRISKRVFQENEARQIFRKTNIFYPLTRTRTCFVFFKHPFWDSPLCFITDDLVFHLSLISSKASNLYSVICCEIIIISVTNMIRLQSEMVSYKFMLSLKAITNN